MTMTELEEQRFYVSESCLVEGRVVDALQILTKHPQVGQRYQGLHLHPAKPTPMVSRRNPFI